MRSSARLRALLTATGLGGALLGLACTGNSPGERSASPDASPSSAVASPTAAATATRAPIDPATTWSDWPDTDFSNRTIDLSEVLRGCPGRDCIPALDADGAVTLPGESTGVARFTTLADVDYPPNYPVAVLTVGNTVKGYPLHILTWHEIVNDVVEGVPVAVTFCPLCNTAIAFDRTVAGTVLDFGVSGNLRNSDLIMWDRQTESWWQQATGEGIVGVHAGTDLKHLPLSVVSFADFAREFPDALVLTEETDIFRDYGVNPYDGYDTFGSRPFLFTGTVDPRLDGLERVVGLGRGSDDFVAVPFGPLSESGIAHVEVSGTPMVVFWVGGTASALGSGVIAQAKDVGAGTAFERTVDGQVLTFEPAEADRFRDTETGSTWDIFGRALDGPLAGQQLAPVIHTTEFWFAWAAFRPDTRIWSGD